MRRQFLCRSTLLAIALTAGSAQATTSRKFDKRLLGTWRSDRELTMKYWRFKHELDTEQRERFSRMFGKLTKRFTATHVYSEFDNERLSAPYSVLAKDAKSVVIETRAGGEPELQQLVFEKEHFYIFVGYNVEFFKRVEA